MPVLGLGLGLQIPNRSGGFTGLLDTYPGAAAAYSLRKLSSSATNVVRVRRTLDDAERDFTATEVSDGTLVTWCGFLESGFVVAWYDQSGNGRNATQATTTAQPQIVSAGSLVAGGLRFDGVDDALNTSLVLTGSFNITAYANTNEIASTKVLFGARDSVNERAYLGGDPNENVTAGVAQLTDLVLATTVKFQNSVGSIDVNGTNAKVFTSGSEEISTTSQTVENTTQGATIGGLNNAGTDVSFWDGTIGTVIAYNTSQAAITPGLQTKLAALYA
jgi:hypothetical protein